MDNGSVGGQVATQIKSLGRETGKQLGEAGEEIVKGTVDRCLKNWSRLPPCRWIVGSVA